MSLFNLNDFVYDQERYRFGSIKSVRDYDDPEGRGRIVEYLILDGSYDTWYAPEQRLHDARWTFVGPVLWPECRQPMSRQMAQNLKFATLYGASKATMRRIAGI